MLPKNNLVFIAKQTLEIIKDKRYISPSGQIIEMISDLDYTISNTKLYSPTENIPLNLPEVKPILEVVNETTTAAALRLQSMGKINIVALNFASGTHEGGGFLRGATAQEEDLCRCSALYACLKQCPNFYSENRSCGNPYYTDNIMYHPQVPFFRNDKLNLLEEHYNLSLITAPAPCLIGVDEIDTKLVSQLILNRIMRILQIAQANGHENIVLGAWGCGAFGNDPTMVAKAFMAALSMIPVFKHVVFAVYDLRPKTPLFETFKDICQ